jgi:hypothetical protein
MDLNVYAAEVFARQFLADRRAQAERHELLQSVRAPRRPLRLTLGRAFIRLGHRLLGGVPAARAKA